jgi:hypothetical protein
LGVERVGVTTKHQKQQQQWLARKKHGNNGGQAEGMRVQHAGMRVQKAAGGWSPDGSAPGCIVTNFKGSGILEDTSVSDLLHKQVGTSEADHDIKPQNLESPNPRRSPGCSVTDFKGFRVQKIEIPAF